MVLTLLTGLIMWAALYEYHAARVGLALGVAAIVAGLQTSRAGIARSATLLVLLGLGLATLWTIFHTGRVGDMVWPAYAGYAGNNGEHGLVDFVRANAAPAATRAREARALYFLRDRCTSEGSWQGFDWTMQRGGLCLLPVAALGVLGLARTLWTWRQRWLLPWDRAAGAGSPRAQQAERAQIPRPRPRLLHLLPRNGRALTIDLASGTTTFTAVPFPAPRGMDCAARIDGRWWVVNPTTGIISTEPPGGQALPQGRWVGVTRNARNQLVLASADQAIAVFEPRTGAEVQRFPAVIDQSRRRTTDEYVERSILVMIATIR